MDIKHTQEGKGNFDARFDEREITALSAAITAKIYKAAAAGNEISPTLHILAKIPIQHIPGKGFAIATSQKFLSEILDALNEYSHDAAIALQAFDTYDHPDPSSPINIPAIAARIALGGQAGILANELVVESAVLDLRLDVESATISDL